MRLCLQDTTIQPIPKGSKEPSLSANYRGIAPLSVSQAFLPPCTGVLKTAINRYLNDGSKVYACLIDNKK